ncbi:hypothetical protein [Saccharothrix sp. HUAS TT1]|uniref:hypothetical protein n=1 Tax=unclassified Saccharothrix TaxID=2593673 RepID=UPI00345BBF19
MSGEDEVPDELRLIPVENSVEGGAFKGVQAGVVHGGIHFGVERETKLVALRATRAELDDVRHHFVPPGGFGDAARILAAHGVVVLAGPGTGRSYAARRLLVDVGARDVVEIGRERPLGSFEDLDEGTGYVWDARETAHSHFGGLDFEQTARRVRADECHLVIVVDTDAQAPAAARGHLARLTAPPAEDVARVEIDRRRVADPDGPLVLVKGELALEDGAPPEKAVRAADLAIRVCAGDLGLDAALAELKEDVEQAVERHLDGLSDLGLALSFAIAVLEHQPYDEVVAGAVKLDEALRKTHVKEDEFRAHPPFSTSKNALLAAVSATTAVRDHPVHQGLREETVHFARQGWAGVVLRRLSREYPLAQDELWRWMCSPTVTRRFREAVQRALITIVTEVPAHEPLHLLDRLAGSSALTHQTLAAAVAARLDERYGELVSQTVDAWVDGTAYRQATAAWFSLALSAARPLDEALRRLELIARSPRLTPQNAVVAVVLSLLDAEEHREAVLDAVLRWTTDRKLARVALPLAMWITGYYPYFRSEELFAAHPDQLTTLAVRALTDPETSDRAFECLEDLVGEARVKPASEKRLRALARHLAPNPAWIARTRAVRALVVLHPGKRAALNRILRHAHRLRTTG